ncbi:MAG: enoyl-CoA hydratase/isomerase family protein [Candidatus Dormibacteraceae bacterium]
MGRTLDVDRRDGIASVVMHRNDNNAIAGDLCQELGEAFDSLGAAPEVRVVVLRSGYERYFSVGADLGAMASVDREGPGAEDRIAEMMEGAARGFAAIERCPKPVIAAINGHALGGGCELALCCDYRIMAEDGRSRIGQTEVTLGIIPGAGGTQRLPRLIGRARALPLLLEGRRLSAREAEEIGLVSRAVAPEDLESAVAELAERLAKGATRAIALIKETVDRGLELPLEEAMKLEARNFARASLTEDAVIGVMSFMAKQEPEFKGR